jgi:hypothetical protein
MPTVDIVPLALSKLMFRELTYNCDPYMSVSSSKYVHFSLICHIRPFPHLIPAQFIVQENAEFLHSLSFAIAVALVWLLSAALQKHGKRSIQSMS